VQRSISIFIVCFFILSACTSVHAPAPVVSLSTKSESAKGLTEITGDSYVVKKGDTLFAVAFYSGNSYLDLATWNNIPSPFVIRPGDKLNLRKINRSNTNLTKSPKKPVSPPKISNVRVDAKPSQAYLGDERNRKSHTDKSKSSVIPYKERRWIWPASGNKKTAAVGSDGSNRGIEIKGSRGSPIIATANGKVVYAGNALKGYGNLIIIKHDDDYLSAYAHNESILVNEHSYVKQGQRIATMGSTGANEVMLHFEIRKRGKSMDPFAYLP